jgi:DNA-binding NarL/FixJ family response regulator
MMSYRILLVDDQEMFAQSMRVVIEASRLSIEKVYVAHDGAEAAEMIAKHPVHVVLMDMHMPNVDGIEGLRRIKEIRPDANVIMLSAFGYDEYVRAAIDLGASGYLLKDEKPAVVINAIEQVVSGGVILSQDTLQALRVQTRHRAGEAKVPPDWLGYLSEKERKILYLIALGQDNEQIADKLALAHQTVRNYVSSIYRKLEVKNRFMAMRMAIEARISEYITDL